MSTKTLARGTTFAFGSGFGIAPTMYRKDSGLLVLERVAMFRSGTFRDSSGYQNTWETIHMKQLIDNYEHLRDKKIFDEIPVRDGHKGWLVRDLPGNGQVMGWHDKIWTEKLTAPHDDVEYDYILADIRITDPAYAAKVENGTLINRSAEIGGYTTNDEAEFWPVYMGVAYVDIPAVEGLRFSRNETMDRQVYVFMDKKETGVGADQNPTGQSTAVPAPLLTAPPQAFSINGASVTDPVAVQQHISALEEFQRGTAEAIRVDYVNGLATANKILASQVDGLVAFAKGLSAEQFAAWKTLQDGTAAPAALGVHGSGVTNAGNAAEGQAVSAADDKVNVDLEVVAMHRRTGTSVENIKKTASYKRLEAAGKAPVL